MKYQKPERISWRPNEDDLILNHWGLGMEELRRKLPGRNVSDIYGRRVYLLKRAGVAKL